MAQMLDPKPKERTLAPGASAGVGDLAAGTGGFLINAHQHILEKATSPGILEYDADGLPHHLIGDLLTPDERKFMQGKKYLRGFDNDSGMTMLRIGSMDLMLHIIPLRDGIQQPQFFYGDTLSKDFNDTGEYDVILMNPPVKGAVDKGTIHPDLPNDTTKSELLFLHLILRAPRRGSKVCGGAWRGRSGRRRGCSSPCWRRGSREKPSRRF